MQVRERAAAAVQTSKRLTPHHVGTVTVFAKKSVPWGTICFQTSFCAPRARSGTDDALLMFRSRCFREIPALITNRLESNARGTIAAMIWGGEWQQTNERFSRLAFGPRTRLLWRQRCPTNRTTSLRGHTSCYWSKLGEGITLSCICARLEEAT